jgi:ferric-dicitrate binding protein FerR (iron transport regulator)
MNNFDRLLEHVAREQDDLLDKHNAQADVRRRLAELDVAELRRTAAVAPAVGKRIAWAGAAGLTLSAAAAALLALKAPEPQPIAARLAQDHTDLEIGQFVQAPQEREVALRFSDGSQIAVARKSRARLMGLRNTGADVSLESGSMNVKVQHREDTSWHIGAGPYGVHVIGTRFDVRYQPEDDTFELSLHEGKVEISGCVFGGGYRMLAGQTVRASCKDNRYDVSSLAGEQTGPAAGSGSVESFMQKPAEAAPEPSPAPVQHAAAPAPVPVPVITPKPEGVGTPAAAPAPRPTRQPAEWQSLARAGHFAQALRAARAIGFERECARGSAEDVSLLAKVARYGQDTDLEASALRLLRERFRGTNRAAWAAFSLGRLEFDNHGAYAEAAEWFRTYLKEQPRGELAREAQGRLLESVERTGDHAGARELATRYLHDYPQGPHADLAHGLLARD